MLRRRMAIQAEAAPDHLFEPPGEAIYRARPRGSQRRPDEHVL